MDISSKTPIFSFSPLCRSNIGCLFPKKTWVRKFSPSSFSFSLSPFSSLLLPLLPFPPQESSNQLLNATHLTKLWFMRNQIVDVRDLEIIDGDSFERLFEGRLILENNDYPGTGANNHHDPKSPARP
ncbi:hypothetical protein IC582_008974 [Cucumis melo]